MKNTLTGTERQIVLADKTKQRILKEISLVKKSKNYEKIKNTKHLKKRFAYYNMILNEYSAEKIINYVDNFGRIQNPDIEILIRYNIILQFK